MSGLIVLLVFAAVALLTLVILSIANRGLRQYEERYLLQGARDLTEMFYFVEGRQLLMLTLALALLLGLAGYALFNWFLGLLLMGAGFFLPFVGIKKLRERRVLKFEAQLVDAMVQMSSAFRAGLTLAQAAEYVAQEMPAPLSQEFGLFVKELKLGLSQDEALLNMAQRVDSEDLQLMVTASITSKQLGGNMAEMFDIISNTIRERFRLEGRIRVLTSQGRLQGWIVGAMPLILGVVLNWMRPDLMEPMLRSSFGYTLIAAVIAMEAVGIFLIRRIVAIDI